MSTDGYVGSIVCTSPLY